MSDGLRWLAGSLFISWSIRAFSYREHPGTPEAERGQSPAHWIIRHTGRYKIQWTARTFVLATALGAGLYSRAFEPAANIHDAFYTSILAVFFADACRNIAEGLRGSIELYTWGVRVQRVFRHIEIPWRNIRLIKRFYALDGWAILRRGKPPVLVSIDMHGLGRFVVELRAHAPQAAEASNLSRFPEWHGPTPRHGPDD